MQPPLSVALLAHPRRVRISRMLSTYAASVTALLVLEAVSALPTHAGDGVLEINQTCAVQTGCFAGDTAGLPVTISALGSYRLTSNLTVADTATHAILVSADDVEIDLNAFAILGPVVCSGSPIVCAPADGTGSGVVRSDLAVLGTSVRHGTVRGMGASGILLGAEARIFDLRVVSNGQNGINVGTSSIIRNITAGRNGAHGINVASASSVTSCVAFANALTGINANSATTVSNSAAYDNQGDGMSGGNGSSFARNTVYQNGDDGILVQGGGTISGNSVYNNDGDGIQSGSGADVNGNAVRNNVGFGLNLGSQSGYHGNVISSNIGGTVNGASVVNLGGNACNGSADCP